MINYLVNEFHCDRRELLDLLSKDGSFIIKRGEDVAVFSKMSPGVVEGHYAFKSKGRKALDVAAGIIKDVFAHGVGVIVGKTPHTNKKARWFSRQLGFESISDIDTIKGPVEVFMLKKGEE